MKGVLIGANIKSMMEKSEKRKAAMSRRDFMKNSIAKTIPLMGLIAFANALALAEDTIPQSGCNGNCQATCATTCRYLCHSDGCSHFCAMGCDGFCTGSSTSKNAMP